jgi:uncharacterized protein YkwD
MGLNILYGDTLNIAYEGPAATINVNVIGVSKPWFGLGTPKVTVRVWVDEKLEYQNTIRVNKVNVTIKGDCVANIQQSGKFQLPCVLIKSPLVPTPPAPTPGLLAQEIVERTNALRGRVGSPPVTISDKLMDAASLQCTQMVSAGLMSHVLPLQPYPRLSDRLTHVDYAFSYTGENIAYGYTDAANVMQAWIGSQGHYNNLVSRAYTQIGVAVLADAKGVKYFAQVFGTPR